MIKPPTIWPGDPDQLSASPGQLVNRSAQRLCPQCVVDEAESDQEAFLPRRRHRVNHCRIQFSNVQLQASRTLSELTLYIEAVRFERWNEKGEPWDLVLIDRGSHTHRSWKDGELHTNPTDVVVEADLYQDEIEWAWEDKPEGTSITVGGSIGVDARPDSFEPDELDELSLLLTCRRDGDSPLEDVTFTDECSGDVEELDPDWIP